MILLKETIVVDRMVDQEVKKGLISNPKSYSPDLCRKLLI
jgi:hypothetical protein